MCRKKVSVNFEDTNVDTPMIKIGFEEGKVPFLACIDTGSELTLVDEAFVKHYRDIFSVEYTDEKLQVISASRTDEVVNIINAYADVCIADKVFPFKGMIKDMMLLVERKEKPVAVPVVFGNDFLKKYNARINYRKKTITFDV